MKRVLVLLSTYNGELFLRDQLDSLYAQKGVELYLLVRDDGSKDSTISMLEEYNSNFGRMDIIYGQNIGAGPSFLALIEEASRNYADFEYFAFSDQDDVWLDNKVVAGVKALENSKNTYQFYFSGAINTDSQLHPVSMPSKTRIISSFGANFVANHILGCTMLFNKALLYEINKINTKPFTISSGKVPIHDGWTSFVAYSLNADVVFNPEGMMYYRQHGNNVIGAGKGFFNILLNRIKRYTSNANHVKANRSIIALQVLDEIPQSNRQLMELAATYKKSVINKIRIILDKRMYEYGLIDNLGTFFLLLLNKF